MRSRLHPLLIVRRRQDTELPSPFVLRYKLRTLLIVVSMACAVFAWAAYLRRMAGRHRDELTRLVSKISETDALQRQNVDEGVQWLAAGTVKAMLIYDPKLGKTFVTYQGPTGGLFQPNSADWDLAAYHKKMAEAYDASLLRPWRLLLMPDHP